MYFRRLMPVAVTIAAEGTRDADGDYTHGAQSTIYAHHEGIDELTELPDGTSKKLTDRLWTDTEVTYNTLVWLPGKSTASIKEARRPMKITAKAGIFDSSNIIYMVDF